MGLSSADDNGVEEVPGREAQSCWMPLWKVGGGHSNKDNNVDDGDDDHNHDGSVREGGKPNVDGCLCGREGAPPPKNVG